MSNSVDVNAAKKRRKKIKKIQKLLCFLVLAAIIFSLYLNRNIWVQKLEGIGSRYTTITQNEGTLAEGNFPLTISGSGEYSIDVSSDRIFILSEDVLYIYTTSGELEKSIEHGLSNTVLKANDNRVLLYEEGSEKFSVYSKSNQIYEDELTDVILFGNISSDGYVALVTESDTFVCSLYIYDSDGKEVYKRNCLDRIMDVTFVKNGCILSTLESEDGNISTHLVSVSFDLEEDNWVSETADIMCLNSFADSDQNIYVVGDTYCQIYDKNGNVISTYTYMSTLVDYDFSDGKLLLLLKDESRHRMKAVMFSSPTEAPFEEDCANNTKKVHIYNGNAYVMGTDDINEYKFDGTNISNIDIDDAYNDFLRIDNYVFLIGYNQINRADFKD